MNFDVDIDTPTKFNPQDIFPWTRACLLKDEKLSPHPCGHYPQNIPIDPLTKLSAIPYEQAEELGYFKVDFLHLSIYDYFQSREEITELLKLEPNWNLLLDKNHVSKLFQLSKHYDLLLKIKPNSIEDIADAIALIRPGKYNLVPLYLKQKEVIKSILYQQTDEFSFKRSHAIAYAHVIVLQLHLIELGIL
jgi:DNA polymerase III alpha subunit